MSLKGRVLKMAPQKLLERQYDLCKTYVDQLSIMDCVGNPLDPTSSPEPVSMRYASINCDFRPPDQAVLTAQAHGRHQMLIKQLVYSLLNIVLVSVLCLLILLSPISKISLPLTQITFISSSKIPFRFSPDSIMASTALPARHDIIQCFLVVMKNSEFKPNYHKVAEEMGFASGMRGMFHHACSYSLGKC